MNDKELKEYLKDQQEEACIKVNDEKTMLNFARATTEEVDYYRNLEFSELLKEYLGLYFIVHIYGQSSIFDCQSLSLMEREVFEFRSNSNQEEFKKKVKELQEQPPDFNFKKCKGE